MNLEKRLKTLEEKVSKPNRKFCSALPDVRSAMADGHPATQNTHPATLNEKNPLGARTSTPRGIQHIFMKRLQLHCLKRQSLRNVTLAIFHGKDDVALLRLALNKDYEFA